MTKAYKTIALFGGTFDPIHRGHIGVAVEAARRIKAEKVIFIPAKVSPLKDSLPKAGDNDRLEMIALATAKHACLEVSDCELTRPSPGYTLETVKLYQSKYGRGTAIHWLLGADSVGDLPRWHRITELIDRCNLSTMYRAGWPPPDFSRFVPIWGRRSVLKLQSNVIETPLIPISSTEIRSRLSQGLDVNDMLDPAVLEYITKHNLYRSRRRQ